MKKNVIAYTAAGLVFVGVYAGVFMYISDGDVLQDRVVIPATLPSTDTAAATPAPVTVTVDVAPSGSESPDTAVLGDPSPVPVAGPAVLAPGTVIAAPAPVITAAAAADASAAPIVIDTPAAAGPADTALDAAPEAAQAFAADAAPPVAVAPAVTVAPILIGVWTCGADVAMTITADTFAMSDDPAPREVLGMDAFGETTYSLRLAGGAIVNLDGVSATTAMWSSPQSDKVLDCTKG